MLSCHGIKRGKKEKVYFKIFIFPAKILASDQRCFSVVDPTLVSNVRTKLKQRWHNYISKLFQRGLNVSKSYIETDEASDKCGFVNR